MARDRVIAGVSTPPERGQLVARHLTEGDSSSDETWDALIDYEDIASLNALEVPGQSILAEPMTMRTS